MSYERYAIYSDGTHIDDITGYNKRDAIAKARIIYRLTGYVTAVRLGDE